MTKREEHAGRAERLLLHTCCGPCAAHCLECLRDDYAVTLFFSNSNIRPEEEYRRRLENARALAARHGLPLAADDYRHDLWLKRVAGLEGEPEKGRRCPLCFAFNLGRTAAYARAHGFDRFTTTLTVSPHKPSPVVFDAGRELGPFLAADFKKHNGFRRSVELSRLYGLYRQSYCGCEFSLRDRTAGK